MDHTTIEDRVIDWRGAMPFAGTVTYAALLLLLVILLWWAEGRRVEGLMPNTGSVVIGGNNVTATGAALMCYRERVVDGEVRLAKTVTNKAPLAARFHAAKLMLGAVLLNGAGSAPSPLTPPERSAPPLMPGDRRAPADGSSSEDEKGLSWRAKAWCGWVLAVMLVIVVFVVRPETFLVSPRIDTMFTDDDEPADGDGDVGERLYCAICMETVPGVLKFSVGSCGHAFCSSCVAQYVAAKLGDNLARVECPDPGCGGVGAVDPESCRGIISPDLLDKWGLLMCESALGAKKYYCPYRECSAPLLADAGAAGAAAIAEAECPHCHRLFCARCAVPWHVGIGCSEFQQLGQDERGREDLLLRRLAGRQMWQRCPKCKMYVEKSEGCNYIKCRCGYSFCYRCASKVSAQTHYCKKCKR